MSLAQTVRKGETLANLSDEVLFERLFYQRGKPTEDLLRIAEACSLLFSFRFEKFDDEETELPFLSKLSGISIQEFHRGVSILHDRTLVQKRGVWRAVLPQALANRLACQALKRISFDSISTDFEKSTDRLFRSFSRRLSFLHTSQEAKQIVRKWISPGGLLGNPRILNDLGCVAFRNIAPVLPIEVLETLERSFSGVLSEPLPDSILTNKSSWANLLKSLSWESNLFPKAAFFLARLAISELKGDRKGEAFGLFQELFFFNFSGSHATVEQRLRILNSLIGSSDPNAQILGFHALEAALAVDHRSTSGNFHFGGHPRDYGWHPKNQGELLSWFRPFLEVAVKQALSSGEFRALVRKNLARQLPVLSVRVGLSQEVEKAALSIAGQEFWPDCWISVKGFLRKCGGKIPEKALSNLSALEKALRPTDLVQTIQAYVLSDLPTGNFPKRRPQKERRSLFQKIRSQ